jgi:uncharacterized membrane protein YqjE
VSEYPAGGSHALSPTGDAGAVGRADAAGSTGIGEALRDVTRDISTLMQQEVALAKAELKQSTSRISQSIGMYAGAGVAAFLFLMFISITVWWAIGNSTGRGWAALIVAIIWLIVAGILALVARSRLRKTSGLSQTTDTLGKVPNALKGHEEENR